MTLAPLVANHARPPLPLPPCPYQFPDPSRAAPAGLVAHGGDFEPETILTAYRAGVFPWPHADDEFLWFSPDPRAIVPVEGLHISRRLARTLRSGRFRVTLDASFEAVIRACAVRDEGTWITSAVIDGYTRLAAAGHAHSFDVWDEDGALVGGLYGVAAGAMFGAESMFHHATDASKVAMVAMAEHAARIGIELIDIQVLTPHTASMGAVEIPRRDYLARLAHALKREVDWRG